MRILNMIVQVPARLLAFLVGDYLHRRVIGRTLVGHHNFRIAVALNYFPEEFQRSGLVALLCDEGLKHLPS